MQCTFGRDAIVMPISENLKFINISIDISSLV